MIVLSVIMLNFVKIFSPAPKFYRHMHLVPGWRWGKAFFTTELMGAEQGLFHTGDWGGGQGLFGLVKFGGKGSLFWPFSVEIEVFNAKLGERALF